MASTARILRGTKSIYRQGIAGAISKGSLMNLSRRQFLGGGLAGASLALAGRGASSSASTTTITAPRRVRAAGSMPRPGLAAGTDQVPEIEHFVVVMMENHSFDNILGLIGRGDGFTLGSNGQPTAKNPDGQGNYVHAFHMPTECQTDGVGNDWKVTHEAYDGGTCQGFVTSTSAEAMGYFTKEDLPFSCGMASAFPIADRYFCSAMAQTDPNRRYLIAGTSLGLINDTFPSGVAAQRRDLRAVQQARHHLEGLLLDAADPRRLPPAARTRRSAAASLKIDQFYVDAAAGNFPSFSLVEPNYDEQSEENPQDIQFGDQFVGKVVNAVMSSPNWPKTMLIWTYDEHGGYYDHVPPPAAIPPDDVPPALAPATRPEDSTGTDSGSRAPWSARTPRRTTSPTRSTTTPRSSRPSRRSGTCLRSPDVTPTPTACSTCWTSTASRRS